MNSLNVPSGGKGSDSHYIYGKSQQFLYMLNGNIQNEDGNSLVVQNEHSNFLCSMFKPGYSYIHHQYNPATNSTYFFIVNEETKCSEIGVIKAHNDVSIEDIEKECNCNYTKILSEPLENSDQEPLCVYETIITDCCNPIESLCLKFDKKHRISSEIKVEAGRTYIYWTDNNQPRRRIDISNPDYYRYRTDDCGDGDPIDECFDCEKLRIDYIHNSPCLCAEEIMSEGNLPEGAYLAFIAYSNEEGHELTRYMSETNWIMVNNLNEKIYTGHDLDRNSGYGIKFRIDGLDTKFKYYTIAIIQESETANQPQNYYQIGVYPTTQNRVSLLSLRNLKRITPQDIFLVKDTYKKHKYVTEANNKLFWTGLEGQVDPNLQKVVNLFGQFMKVRTMIGNEDLYEDGKNVSKYEQYMGDEVYAFSFSFITNQGYVTPLYPTIGRCPEELRIDGTAKIGYNENDRIDLTPSGDPIPDSSLDLNYAYISNNQYKKSCAETERNKWFQYYNTGYLEDYPENCQIADVPVEEKRKTLTRTIETEEIYELPDVTISLENGVSKDDNYEYISLSHYWYQHSSLIKDSTYTDVFGLLCVINSICLLDPPDNIIHELFPNSCEDEDFTRDDNSVDIVVVDDGEISDITQVYKDLSEYSIKSFKDYCTNLVAEIGGVGDTDLHKYKPDTELGELFMPLSTTTFITHPNTSALLLSDLSIFYETARLVWQRTNNMKQECDRAISSPMLDGQLDIPTVFHVPPLILPNNPIATDYINTRYESVEDLSKGFYSNLHKNAVWFNAKNSTSENITFVISRGSRCDNKDRMDYSEYIRMSVYDRCNSSNGDNLVYSKIYKISDGHKLQLDDTTNPFSIPAVDDTQYKPLENNKEYYIAFDTPVVTTVANYTGSNYVAANIDKKEGFETEGRGAVNITYLSGTCGCSEMRIYETDVIREEFTLKGAKVRKLVSYWKECYVKIYGDISCDPELYEQWNFGYHESSEKYPCNNELYNSKKLVIGENDIPSKYKEIFEDKYVESTDANGDYELNDDANFVDKNIRHFRIPNIDHQFGEDLEYGANNKIIIKGVWIDNELISSFLDIAVKNGLINQEFRDSIVGYEIYRGDRRTNKSIIAKGLGYDMLQYEDEFDRNKIWQTQNYPFNDLREDILHNSEIQSDIQNLGSKMTFLSPNTFFNRPLLDNNIEVGLNYFMYGETRGNFDQVEDYPKMILLSQSAYTTAETLAWAEVIAKNAAETAIMLSNNNEVYRVTAGFSNSVNPAGIGFRIAAVAAFIANIAINTLFNVGKIKSQWIDIFYNNGEPQNFAYLYVGVSRYENISRLDRYESNSLRPIANIHYLNSERYELNGLGYKDIAINNYDRDKAVYINLGEHKDPNGISDINFNYGRNKSIDLSRHNASMVDACESGLSRDISGRYAASPYLTLKKWVPGQYGTIDSIVWYTTGHCGSLEKDYEGNLRNSNYCEVIFGGDTYISRFSYKRKMKFFRKDAFGGRSLTPFNHSDMPYLTDVRYWVDYNKILTDSVLFAPYTTKKSPKALDCRHESGNYFTDKSKFYLYYFGIVHFLVESEYNLNYRYAQNDKELNIYENSGNYIDWIQPKNVPFAAQNWSGGYLENIYSRDIQRERGHKLDETYNQREWEALADYSDRTIYSDEDNQERGIYDPYMNYRPFNAHDFGREMGTIYGMFPIDNLKVMARFENGFVVFNAFSTIRGTTEDYQIGTGGIFKNRPTVFYKSDLGYGGTQHRAIKSTKYGVYWVDAKRGHVFNLPPGANTGIKEISSFGEYNWFKENLPFQILKDFNDLSPDVIDNTLIGIGISIGWDERYQRVFFTKRDARVKLKHKDKISYTDGCFFYTDTDINPTPEPIEVYPKDEEYFDDCSWTRAYYPWLEGGNNNVSPWMGSFYSFKPEEYIDYNNYFQTVFSEGGLWSHLISNRSYQVYYGNIYPFKLINKLEEQYVNQRMSHYEYWLDVYRYHNEIDYAEIDEANFDWACVYTKNKNSGKLVLVNKQDNDLSQELEYPKFNTGDIEILATKLKNRFAINTFWNMVNDNSYNIPIWNNTKPNDDKVLNSKAFDYDKSNRDYIEGDVVEFLLVQEKESRLKYIVKFIVNQSNIVDR